jgi:RNA polymerase sigma factor (sigma-70 family)
MDTLHFDQFVRGNESSFAYIYNRFFRRFRGYGLRIVEDEFVVNTILQEAFLKAWAFRERMTSLDHLTRFLKLNIRWECLAYYRIPIETLYRKAIRLNWTESWQLASPDPEDNLAQAENQLHLLRSMVSRLPDYRQRTVVSLYVKDGMTIGQIGQRLHISPQMVGKGLTQGLDHLRLMLIQPKKQAHLAELLPTLPPMRKPLDGLSKEQTHIITMRRDMKYSFSQIADLLKLPQPYVQKQYVEAWKKCCEAKA